MPANNDLTFCSSTTRSCYYMRKSKNLAYGLAKAACGKMGGYLVAYNSGAEQLAVETYFRSTCGSSCCSAGDHVAQLLVVQLGQPGAAVLRPCQPCCAAPPVTSCQVLPLCTCSPPHVCHICTQHTAHATRRTTDLHACALCQRFLITTQCQASTGSAWSV